MIATIIWVIVLTGVALGLYHFLSSYRLARNFFMLAGGITTTIVGFTNSFTTYEIFTEKWWQTTLWLLIPLTIMYMFLFSDLAWEIHYVRYGIFNYNWLSDDITYREEIKEETHPFTYVFISIILSIASIGLCTLLQDMAYNRIGSGYLFVGLVGLIVLLIMFLRWTYKIVKARRYS